MYVGLLWTKPSGFCAHVDQASVFFRCVQFDCPSFGPYKILNGESWQRLLHHPNTLAELIWIIYIH